MFYNCGHISGRKRFPDMIFDTFEVTNFEFSDGLPPRAESKSSKITNDNNKCPKSNKVRSGRLRGRQALRECFFPGGGCGRELSREIPVLKNGTCVYRRLAMSRSCLSRWQMPVPCTPSTRTRRADLRFKSHSARAAAPRFYTDFGCSTRLHWRFF